MGLFVHFLTVQMDLNFNIPNLSYAQNTTKRFCCIMMYGNSSKIKVKQGSQHPNSHQNIWIKYNTFNRLKQAQIQAFSTIKLYVYQQLQSYLIHDIKPHNTHFSPHKQQFNDP